jgi:hypothetical protein
MAALQQCPASLADVRSVAITLALNRKAGKQMTITQELIDAERKRFETSAQLKYLDFSKTKDAWGKEIYFYTHVEAMWQGWQAAISQHKAVQDGYVLVPKEPTNEMIYAGMEAIDNFTSPVTTISCYTQMLAAAPSDNKALVESEPVDTADYIAYLYSDGNKLKVAEEMPPPDNAFPVFTTNIRFLDVARLVLDDNVDLILEHGGVKLWEALVTKINQDYAEKK